VALCGRDERCRAVVDVRRQESDTTFVRLCGDFSRSTGGMSQILPLSQGRLLLISVTVRRVLSGSWRATTPAFRGDEAYRKLSPTCTVLMGENEA